MRTFFGPHFLLDDYFSRLTCVCAFFVVPLQAENRYTIMSELLNVNKGYRTWVETIKARYKQSQTRALLKANQELMSFYWHLGRDIVEMHVEEQWGKKVLKNLSQDLQRDLPDVTGLSETSLGYMKRFYLLYSQIDIICPQAVGEIDPQAVGELFSIPWGHHRFIIDKCYSNPQKALFFAHKTYENNWGRDVLLNFMDTDLYEREGKAITNFSNTLPAIEGDLAQQMTRDPYCFGFLTLNERYREKELKDALMQNLQQFLLELGTGFAYIGREYRLQIDDKTEQFIDMLFYNISLHSYVVIEIKTGEFSPSHLGQLSTYVSAVNHLLVKEGDNPTIGLLVCKTKSNTLAQYSLEGYNLPLGISEYQLNQILPKQLNESLPALDKIEHELENNQE